MTIDRTKALENTLTYRTRGVLRWKSANGAEMFPIEGRVVVGSAPQSAVCLPSEGVSRIHAELSAEPNGVWVSDLDSTNGTFVSGVRVARALVPDGATITFGDFRAIVGYEKTIDAARAGSDAFENLIGHSSAMQHCFALLRQAAATDVSVLISGETGVGKDVCAQALHAASARKEGRFVVVDCGALPENILEAELFGHARGAFTGAQAAREGAFEAADKGTLFIDEVGEIPLSLQPKLLRMLEARAVRRLGETHYRSVDTRVVAATHRDLRSMVNQGLFREDLYFRLAVLPVHVPPLRDRRDDICLLLERFFKGALPPIDPARLAELVNRPWPGNVRELRNFADRVQAVGFERAMELSFGAMELADEAGPVAAGWNIAQPSLAAGDKFETIEEYRGRAERLYLDALLKQYNYNISHAAKAAGIGRGHLYRLMRRWNL